MDIKYPLNLMVALLQPMARRRGCMPGSLKSWHSNASKQNYRSAFTLALLSRKTQLDPGQYMKKIASLILAVAAVAVAVPASAQFAKPEDAVKYRKNALFVMQQNFSRVAAMAAGKAPFDAKVAAESAAVAEFMSKLPWAGFGAGTDVGETKAKPEIWKEPAKFKDYSEKLQAEMSKLAVAAKSGNLDSIKVAVADTGQACKACHDSFRNK